jgi:hypothetical protein
MFATIKQALVAYKTQLRKYRNKLKQVPADWEWDDFGYYELEEWNHKLTGWEKALGLTKQEITAIYREIGIVRSKSPFSRDIRR